MNQNALAAARRFAEGLVDVPDAEPAPRVFLCSWGEPTYKQHSSRVGIEFFSNDNGYDDFDRNAIDSLAVGDTCAPCGSHHTITREA